MLAALKTSQYAIKQNSTLWITITLGFPVVYYSGLMIALMVRFEGLPNYIRHHEWVANVAEIIQSTPSIIDMIPIILEEWSIEIGHMNYDFGNGVSEWSLTIIPPNVVLVVILSGFLATNIALLKFTKKECSSVMRRGLGASAGIGTILVGMTSVTLSWVVCCATPTWVVGLAMLGLGTTASFWLEPLGPWLTMLGFILLASTAYFLASSRSRTPKDTRTISPLQQTG